MRTGLATGLSRYARVYHARVPTPPFDRADYQLPPVPSSVFNDLSEEVSETRRLANEAKREAHRLAPPYCGGVEEAVELRTMSSGAQSAGVSRV
jgi:hypothetical protein